MRTRVTQKGRDAPPAATFIESLALSAAQVEALAGGAYADDSAVAAEVQRLHI